MTDEFINKIASLYERIKEHGEELAEYSKQHPAGTLPDKEYNDDDSTTIRRWYDNGSLAYEKTYKDERRNGIQRYWYENGQPRSECYRADDCLSGISYAWFENGNVDSEAHYYDNRLHGFVYGWHPDSTLANVEIYISGKLKVKKL